MENVELPLVWRTEPEASEEVTGLISNAPERKYKVLLSLEHALSTCTRFDFSVSFVMESGLSAFQMTLDELEAKGIPGRILTSDYLCVTQPSALKKLLAYKNIEVRLYRCEGKEGFHTKGYVFHREGPLDALDIMVGSSNLSGAALTTTHEWNAMIRTNPSSLIAREVLAEFESLWASSKSVRLTPGCAALAHYEARYEALKKTRLQPPLLVRSPKEDAPRVTTNAMQSAFVENVLALREAGETKALLISATGTGKTYASAFAVKALKPRRFLFVVHSEKILRQALASYERVFGDEPKRRLGLFLGANKAEALNADFVFTTVATLYREEHLGKFDPASFDVICIDEVHHATATAYQRLMTYFKPRFWLGLTATPDRRDAANVYALFDHNIAQETRLHDALAAGYLADFHYFGVSDVIINGEVMEARHFEDLVSEARVAHILRGVRHYRSLESRVKGLVFCSRNDEAQALAEAFTLAGEPSMALSGKDSEDVRQRAISRLVSEDESEWLHYLFTVDIFNEGVDIPEINQVVLLRPTESPVVFTQQLGRGLRKHPSKDYVTIIDFIGNYDNNYMIPVALSGDRTARKSVMRQWVVAGNASIPGASIIQIDPIAKRRILEAIDREKTNTKAKLSEAFLNLLYRLNRRPTLLDFYRLGELDPALYLAKRQEPYWCLARAFMAKAKDVAEDPSLTLSAAAMDALGFFGRALGEAHRPGEGWDGPRKTEVYQSRA